MAENLSDLRPTAKLDIDKAERLVALGFPVIEGMAAELLEWTQDPNWPVAQVLYPFFAGVGRPLAPHLRAVFETEDGAWKYHVLTCIVARSSELREALLPEIERMALRPTPIEQAEEVHLAAQEVLEQRS